MKIQNSYLINEDGYVHIGPYDIVKPDVFMEALKHFFGNKSVWREGDKIIYKFEMKELTGEEKIYPFTCIMGNCQTGKIEKREIKENETF